MASLVSTAVTGTLSSTQSTKLGTGTLTANNQNDVVLFSAGGTYAQMGHFYNKLKLLGGDGQSRDLQIWQQYNEYAHLGTSWNDNKLYVDSDFTEFTVNTNFRAQSCSSQTITVDGSADITFFGTGDTAQAGAFFSKLKIKGGGVQSRDLQLWQEDSGYSHIGTSWTSNQLYIDDFSGLYVSCFLAVQATKKLYLDGGSNTYIQEVAADQMAFVTGGAEQVRIIADGKVGIGTTDPGTYKLKVEGTTWLNDQAFIAGNNTAPPATSNSQDFGAIRMSDGALRSMYQGCTATYGWISVSKSTDHSVNYPLVLNPNGGAVGIGTDISNLTGDALLCVGGVQDVSSGAIAQFGSSASDFMRCGWYISQQTGSNPALRPNATGFNGDIGSDANSFSKLWCSGWSVRKDTTAGEMRSRLASGYPGLEFVDQATGGDMSWCIGGHDRGGVGQPGQNAFIFKYLRGTRFNESWYDEGTEAMCIDDSGNVGIGYINPGAKLAVGGSVGIGTTNPGYLLHLEDAGSDLLKLRSTGGATANAPKILFEHTDAGVQSADIVFDQSAQNTLKFTTYYQSVTDINRIQFAPADSVAMTICGGTNGEGKNGFVGIGTASPESSLHVEKLTGGTSIQLSAGNYGTNYGSMDLDSQGFGLSSGNRVRALTILHSNQFVGIGTAVPIAKLQVSGRIGGGELGNSKVTRNGLLFSVDFNDKACVSGTSSSEVPIDLGPNNYSMSLYGGANFEYKDGIGCYYFDGSADHISIADYVVAGNANSYEIWHYANVQSGWETWWDSGTERPLLGSYNSTLQVYPNGTNLGTINTGKWYHVVWAFASNSDVDVFINGVRVTEALNYGATQRTGTFEAWLGGDNGAEATNGWIAVARTYNRQLTPADVLQNYNAEVGTFATVTPELGIVQSGGNVGIGITNPNQPLVVVNPVNTANIPTIGAYTNNLSVGVQLHHYGLKAASSTADGSTALDANQKIMLDARGTGDVLIQTLGGTGHVGIGTAVPGEKLTVWNSNISLGKRQNSVTSYVGKGTGANGQTFGSNSNWIAFASDGSDDWISFGTHESGVSGGERVRIAPSGNVGIGTTSPGSYKLKVEGTTWFNDQAFIAGNNTAPPATSNSQDFGAIRMSDGALRSMYQGCTATYGWIQVSKSTNHATNYPLYLNPNGGAISFNGAYTFPTADGTSGYHLQTDGAGAVTWAAGGAGTVTGTGTTNYVSKWTGASSQGNSSIFDNGTSVGIGTDSPTGKVQIDGLTAARFLTLNAPTDGGYITFETANTAFADIGSAKGMTVNAAYSATDLMINTRSGTKNIVFGMNGVEKVRIDNNGKVGIGTSAPSQKLHVTGYARVTGWLTGANDKNTLYSSDGTGVLLQASLSTDSAGGTIHFRNAGGTVRHTFNQTTGEFTSSGKVGIGTNNPLGLLTLHQAAGANIRFQNATTGRYFIVGEGVGTNDKFSFRGNSYRSTDTLTVDFANNRVGVANISPTTALQIGGYGGTNSISFYDANQYIRSDSGTNMEFGANYGFQFVAGNSANSSFMGGKVGIGTATPLRPLHVEYSSSATDVTADNLSGQGVGGGALIYNNTQADNVFANLDFRAKNADGRIAYQYKTAVNVGDFHFITDNSGSPETKMLIANDGKVGIGTTNPSSLLHVNGASLLGGTTTIGGNLVPAISTLMDIGTSSFKWRNLVLSGTAGIGGALTGTSATFSGRVLAGSTTAGTNAALKLQVGDVLDATSAAVAQFNGSIRADLLLTHATSSSAALQPNASGFNGSIGTSTNSFENLWCSGWSVRKTTAAGEMRSRLDSGYPGIEFVDQATGGDMSWCIGGHDRGGVGTPGQNAFIFKYNRGTRFNESWYDEGTEAMCIDDAGRVGIGNNPGSADNTTTPRGRLDVVGDVVFAHDTTSPAGYIVGSDFALFGSHSATGTLMEIFANNDTSRFKILGSGNVGIGTASPNQLLTLGSSDGTQVLSFTTSAYMGDQAVIGNIEFSTHAADASYKQLANIYALKTGTNTNSGALTFWTKHGGGRAERVRIAESGSVGIGTTSPGSYKLKVEGTTWLNDQAFIAGNNTAPPTSSNSQDFGAIRMSDGALRSMYQGCTATYGWIQVMSSTNHATNYPLALNPNGGSVGIGTNAPAAPLDVHGSMVRISSDGGAYRRLMFFDSLATPSKNNFQVAVQEINNALHIGPSTAVGGTTFSGSTGLAMLANGSVGIGDASPTYKLDVNGTFRATGTGTFDSTLSVGDDFTAIGNCQLGNSYADSHTIYGQTTFLEEGTEANSIYVRNVTNDGRASISFSDVTGESQKGYLRYAHADSRSNGTGNSFHFDCSGETTTAVIIDQTAGHSGFYVGSVEDAATYKVAIRGGAASYFMGGSVGIGTTAPACMLHVERRTYSSTSRMFILTNSTNTPYGGAGYDTLVINQDDVPCIRLRETAGANPELTLAVGNENSQSAVIGTTGMLRFCTNRNAGTTGYSTTNTRMVIDEANGYVGIGTVSPGGPLDVYASGVNIILNTPASDYAEIQFEDNGTTKWRLRKDSSNEFDIFSDSGYTSRFHIKQDGNVGIGETAPAHKLSIGDVAAIHLGYNSTSANYEVGRITSNAYNVDNSAYSLAEMVLLTSSANGYTGSIQFRTNSVNSTNTRAAVRMTILSNGNVGIGTTNPGTWKLRVEGTGFFNGSVVIPNSGSYFGAYNSSGTLKSLIYLSSSNEVIINKDHLSAQPTKIRGKYITFETPDSVLGADIEVMRVFQGSGFMTAGCVGIGVTTPSSKLDVNGTITGTSKNFNIPHPDPSKVNARLIHASIEAPSNDTLYKFEVVISLDNETVTHPLPSYFKYLNKNPRMWIQARDMFSHAYGSCAEDLSSFSITGEKAGSYDVLIIATRKDEGVEGFVVEIDA